MVSRNKKKLNLLEMPDPEKVKLIRKAREELKQRTIETKLMQSFLEAENIIINGNIVYRGNERLTGLSFEHEI